MWGKTLQSLGLNSEQVSLEPSVLKIITFDLDMECDFVSGHLTGIMSSVCFLGALDDQPALRSFGDHAGPLIFMDLHLVLLPGHQSAGRGHLAAQVQVPCEGGHHAHGASGLVDELHRFVLKQRDISLLL